MQSPTGPTSEDAALARRSAALFAAHQRQVYQRTDRVFATLLICEWLAGIAVACWLSPLAWAGLSSQVHPHVWVAVFLGLAIISLPVLLALTRPGHVATRQAIAVGQMLLSALLIHLTGGRIETHFHVFGSLAFLAFYRDWSVLVSASAVVAADHMIRGLVWPQSVFGVLSDQGWRWLEHAGWVLFEDAFLIPACLRGVAEMRTIAERQARLEALNAGIEATVQQRTVELARAEADFRSIFENATEGIFQSSPDGRFLRVNPALARLYGYESPADLMCQLSDIAHQLYVEPGRRAEFAANLDQEGQLSGFESEVYRRDRTVIWIVENARAVRDEHGQLLYYEGTVRDITRRKRAEEALRESEKRLRTVVANAPVILFALDKDGRVTLSEGQRLTALGLRPGELVGQSVFDVYRDTPATIANMRRALTGEAFTALVSVGQTTFETHHAPLWGEDGQIAGVIGVATDVTESRAAQERIREQAALLDKAQDAIIVCDPVERIVYWNASATRLYGWTAAEAIGRRTDELLGCGPHSETEQVLRTLRERREWTGEMRHQRKDGREVRVEGRWTLIDDEAGRPKGRLMVHTDVTERKKLEAQFLRAQRLESIGTLAGGIAHDLNNTLTPMLMATQMLALCNREPRERPLLESLETGIGRAADMVKQILSFARGAEGKHDTLMVGTVAAEVARILRRTLPKTIAVELAQPSNLWLVNGDATQLHQVLMNLCLNARDAMPNGGRLTVTLENMILDATHVHTQPEAVPGPHVVISVADTGTGMPPDVLDRIFDPFFTTKGIGSGTGLGLSTARGIVKSHGGFIVVYSESGRGTRFTVYLPAIPDGTTAAAPVAPVIPTGNGRVVLVVDDEAAIRDTLRATLKANGYEVLTAAHGGEAVTLYQAHGREVQVVLTDWMMPTMDGPATIRALRRLDPAIRIVAASGLTVGRTPAEMEGVRAFLAKPYRLDQLLTVLHEACA